MVELHYQNYNENKKKYNQVLEKLRTKINDNIPINHVGSTVLPDMYGKNIIDILIGVKKEEINKYTNILIELGYFLGTNNSDYHFFANTKEETASGDIHLHLVDIDTSRYKDFLILKDYLLNNKIERKKYSEFKKKIISDGYKERKDYKIIKSKYVEALLEKARNYNLLKK